MDLRSVSAKIIHAAIHSALPDEAVKRALLSHPLRGNVTLVAIGKAAWQMAHAAVSVLPRPVTQGIVITKYGHALGSIPGVHIFEAGHPVPDANSYLATQAVIDMVWGEITVHWFRRYGQLTLHVTVPFAPRTRIVFSEKACEVGSGFHVFSIDESADT